MIQVGKAHGNARAFTNVKRDSRRMETSLFNRLQATLLALATAGLVLLAVLNFRQESRFQQPDDGVWWVESQGGLLATKVLPDSAGLKAGIQKGDLSPQSMMYLLPGSQTLSASCTSTPASTAKQTIRSRATASRSIPQLWSFLTRRTEALTSVFA